MIYKTFVLLEGAFLILLGIGGCIGIDPEGLSPAPHAETTVKIDLLQRPLPELPLPNDLATRYDPGSPTGRRLNISLLAPTRFESELRALVDKLDGWSVFGQISIPFTGPLDIQTILKAHRDNDYDLSDDVVYLIDVDRRSPEFGRIHHLDVGNGNYPLVLERRDYYWPNDPREFTMSLLFEEADEDLNGNGRLDPGEDTDADGVLDRSNYLPGARPAPNDLAGRADALMTFYERETNTLLLRPMLPLRERTTYAVVVTRRLKDEAGRPVGSPYPFVNHTSQTRALEPLRQVLPSGLDLTDIAFAFSFTTQSIEADLVAARDGLYGHGAQAQLGREFPAEIEGLEKLRDPKDFPYLKNPYILYPEEVTEGIKPLIGEFLGFSNDSVAMQRWTESQRYVGFHVVGSYRSPQLFARTITLPKGEVEGHVGEEGEACRPNRTCLPDLWCLNGLCIKPLPLNAQSWPSDLERTPAEARSEDVFFWLVVPREEISARGRGKPAPVIIHAHGTGNSKIEAMAFGGYLAKYGFATLTFDLPSHGLPTGKSQEELIKLMLRGAGLGTFIDAISKGRAFDQNNDGKNDSAADFWTAYGFHARDMIRQSVLDLMQLVRVLRGFDGIQRWKMDVNGDGAPELAGDFDGDGRVDVGGDAAISMTGISLGGIVTLLTGSMEPEIRAIAPISGGAGLEEVAIRSRQNGVPEAFMLRLMGPLYLGTLDPRTGETVLATVVPDLNTSNNEEHAMSWPFAAVRGVVKGDTLIVENLITGERGCGTVSSEGKVRAGVASNQGDRVRVELYAGDVLDGPECRLRAGVLPKTTVETFEQDVVFQSKVFSAGEPLVALAEGLGLRRASPALRRFLSLGQASIDPGDPASYLRHLQQEPLTYPGTQQTTGAHALIITTVGDMAVPASTGVAAGRAAGLIDFLHADPRYGKPVNQVLIDTYTCEAVNKLKRFTSPVDPIDEGVHLDVENFSNGTDMWGNALPRLNRPLRIGWDQKDPLGGASAAIFPLADTKGSHFFDFPGQMIDKARAFCRSRCPQTEGENPCGCDTETSFDVGMFLYNMMGRYFASGGTLLSDDLCQSRDDCSDRAPPPGPRDSSTLR